MSVYIGFSVASRFQVSTEGLGMYPSQIRGTIVYVSDTTGREESFL